MRVLILQFLVGSSNRTVVVRKYGCCTIHMVDLDEESIELSKVLHKHYAQEKFVNIRHWNLDIPFEFENLNKIEVDVVICALYRTTLPVERTSNKNPKAVFAIQNSNVVEEMFGINCVGNLEDLKEQVGIDECGYEGTRQQTYYSWMVKESMTGS